MTNWTIAEREADRAARAREQALKMAGFRDRGWSRPRIGRRFGVTSGFVRRAIESIPAQPRPPKPRPKPAPRPWPDRPAAIGDPTPADLAGVRRRPREDAA